MECINIESCIDEYLDGTLSEEKKAELEEHLENCTHCKDLLNDRKNMLHILTSLDEMELPEGFHDRLSQRIRQEADIARAQKISRRNWYRLGAAVAAVFVLAFSIKLVDIVNTRHEDLSDSPAESSGLESAPDISSNDANDRVTEAPDIMPKIKDQAPQEPAAIAEGDEGLKFSIAMTEDAGIEDPIIEVNIYSSNISAAKDSLYTITSRYGRILEDFGEGIVLELTDEWQRQLLLDELQGVGRVEPREYKQNNDESVGHNTDAHDASADSTNIITIYFIEE